MTDEAEILEEFLVEAREIIDKLDSDFLQLEKSPADGNLLGDVFRGVNTLKGSSGFFSFKRLELVSHAGESLLSKLREKSLELTTDMVTILLRTLDTLRDIVDDIEANRAESAGDDTLLLANLQSLTVGGGLINELEEDNPVATGASPAVDGVDGVDGVGAGICFTRVVVCSATAKGNARIASSDATLIGDTGTTTTTPHLQSY